MHTGTTGGSWKVNQWSCLLLTLDSEYFQKNVSSLHLVNCIVAMNEASGVEFLLQVQSGHKLHSTVSFPNWLCGSSFHFKVVALSQM